jgi:hypothetical protein
MKSKNDKMLTKMLAQFQQAHGGAMPLRIVVEPIALVALGIKKSCSATWSGVPVMSREIEQSEVRKPGKGTSLAVILDTKTSQLVATDLAD